jgi:hypothetical protein
VPRPRTALSNGPSFGFGCLRFQDDDLLTEGEVFQHQAAATTKSAKDSSTPEPKEGEQPAREICNALLDYAVKRDEHLQQIGEDDVIDDKTVFIIKRR